MTRTATPAITPDAPAPTRNAYNTLAHAHGHLRDHEVSGEGWTSRWYAYQILRSAQAILAAEGELQAVLLDLRGELDE